MKGEEPSPTECKEHGPYLRVGAYISAKLTAIIFFESTFIKTGDSEPWLVWLSGLSAGLRTKGSLVLFPVRTHAWVMGQVPGGAL